MNMPKELPKTYDPKQVEDRIYDFWIKNNYFKAERDPDNRLKYSRFLLLYSF